MADTPTEWQRWELSVVWLHLTSTALPATIADRIAEQYAAGAGVWGYEPIGVFVYDNAVYVVGKRPRGPCPPYTKALEEELKASVRNTGGPPDAD